MTKNLTPKESLQILKNNYIGYIGCLSGDIPIVLPVTYYFDSVYNTLISYSLEGLKIDAMRKHKTVTFSVSEIKSVNQWKSVLAYGTFEELEGATAKEQLHLFARGVKEIINLEKVINVHFIKDFSKQIHGDEHPVVYRIKINKITGKQRN